MGGHHERPRPGRFSRMVVAYPVAVMMASGGIAIVLAMLAFTAGESELGGSFTDTEDPIVRKLYGFLAMRHDYWSDTGREEDERRRLGEAAPRRRPRSRVETAALAGLPAALRLPKVFGRRPARRARRRLDEEDEDWWMRPQRQAEESCSVILRAKGASTVLGGKGLETLRKLIRQVQRTDGFADYCLSDDGGATCVEPTSLFRGVYDASAAPSNDCALATYCAPYWPDAVPACAADAATSRTSDYDPGDALYAMCNSTDVMRVKRGFRYSVKMSANASGAEADCRGGLAAQRAYTVGGGWDCDSNKVSYAAFTFSTGFPLSWSGDAGSDEDWEEMEDWAVASLMPKLHKLKKDLEEVDGDDEPDFELLFNGIDPIQYYLNEDLRMLNLAMAIVLIILILQTGSIFIALCGLFEIAISFPCGLFVWTVLMGEEYITYLMYNGAFIILGIGADDIFVLMDAWKQSALHPDPEVRGDLLLRFAWAYERAASAMLATSFTTWAAFTACAFSAIWDIRCFGVVSGVMVLADYVLAAAVTPAESPPAPEKGAAYVVPDGARLVEKVYGGVFADAIIKFHKPLIAIFIAIFVAATAIWTTTLVPATDALDFFDKQHVYTQHTKALRENDCVGSANYKGIDLCGHQQEFIDASQAYFEVIQAKGGAPHYETAHYNFMSDFKNYVEHEGSSFPYEPSDCGAFAAKLLEFRDSWDWPYGNMHDDAHGLRGDMTGFVLEGSVVKAAYAGFNTTLSRSDSFEELWDFYDAGESALKAARSSSGDLFAGRKPYQTTEFNAWMVASGVFLRAAAENISISLALAFVVMLIATGNWIVTAVAFVSLLCVVSVTLALMALAGWEVNVIESIDISIAGGMAVDYVLHMAHAYNHQPPSWTREDRVKSAMGEMGVSVLSGMLTTFGACCALFACQLLWFRRFGIFITMLIMSSFFVSTFAMMPALVLCGPTGGKGDLRALLGLPAKEDAAPVQAEPVAKKEMDAPPPSPPPAENEAVRVVAGEEEAAQPAV
ncbi:hypothetical protein JL720_10854 [Aureococcus anophagefferens]|nr:hypothetical protein JL720_10854 [Aureococcus anophagefferens]